MNWLKRIALRYALTRNQRAWIWNSILYSRNRYAHRGDTQNLIAMTDLVINMKEPLFSKNDPLRKQLTGKDIRSCYIPTMFIRAGEELPADVKQVMGEDGEPDIEIDEFCR